jgi:hypothetical protein
LARTKVKPVLIEGKSYRMKDQDGTDPATA